MVAPHRHRGRTWAALVLLALCLATACIGLDPTGKNRCEVQSHCLDGYVCVDTYCVPAGRLPDAPLGSDGAVDASQ